MNMAANKKAILIAGGSATTALLIGTIAFNSWRKKKDQMAIAFFSELQREIAPDSVGLVESNAFDMRYWENIGKKLKKALYFLKVENAKAYAKDIRSAWGWIDDDEDKIKGVFRALKDQVQVSQVAYWYYQGSTEKINLIDDLKSRLSKEEVGEIMGIVKKLPQYRLAETKK